MVGGKNSIKALKEGYSIGSLDEPGKESLEMLKNNKNIVSAKPK